MTRRASAGDGASLAVIGVMAAGAAVAVAGSLATWVRTGARGRHSYAVFELVGRLGFRSGGVEALALRWWPTMPMLAVGAVVAAWWGARAVGGALGVAAGAYAGGVGTVVATASAARGVDVRAGPAITAVGGWILAAASLALLALAGASSLVSRSTTGKDGGR